MHLFALTQEGERIAARKAVKGEDYKCLECKEVVRLKEGFVRQAHFFHLQQESNCRQTNKSLPHIHAQCYVLRSLPMGDGEMEYPFPKIDRIADVVWFSKRIVFEIQCSPISRDEVKRRNIDYGSEGFQVVWIFLSRVFNLKKVSGAERHLRGEPYYFTDMSHQGKGVIFDQWQWVDRGLRKKVSPPLPIDISRPYFDGEKLEGFEGDYKSLKEGSSAYVREAEELEKYYTGSRTEAAIHLRRSGKSLSAMIKSFFSRFLRRFCKENAND